MGSLQRHISSIVMSNCMSYKKTFEKEDLNSHQVTKNSTPIPPERDGRDSSPQGNEVRPHSPPPEANQPESEVCPQSLSSKHAVSSLVQDSTP